MTPTAGDDSPVIWVELEVSGEHLDPEWVTGKVGIQPTKAARRGDRKVPGAAAWRCGWWALSVGPDRCLDTEPLTERLMAILAGTEVAFAEVAAVDGVAISFRVLITQHSARVPAVVVSPPVLRWLASARAGMEVDIVAALPGSGCETPEP